MQESHAFMSWNVKPIHMMLKGFTLGLIRPGVLPPSAPLSSIFSHIVVILFIWPHILCQ